MARLIAVERLSSEERLLPVERPSLEESFSLPQADEVPAVARRPRLARTRIISRPTPPSSNKSKDFEDPWAGCEDLAAEDLSEWEADFERRRMQARSTANASNLNFMMSSKLQNGEGKQKALQGEYSDDLDRSCRSTVSTMSTLGQERLSTGTLDRPSFPSWQDVEHERDQDWDDWGDSDTDAWELEFLRRLDRD
eukprot:TRINITY_DN982_c0_g1_i1.p2 TRINITY_DN982_c0_g1~~TRINITY_DN982_c0_g1_i1.p2  ORF type:complete len:195 (+),score=34.49 TRINITY_DN982_c0_g1_i1:56-640(+)